MTAVSLTFPATRTPPPNLSSVAVYTDSAGHSLATITTVAGAPVPGSRINVGLDGLMPEFLGPAGVTVLYGKTAAGVVFVLHPQLAVNPATVTGSKGSNAALTSLMAALNAAGIVVDATT
jgi:hypothetical protein